MQEASLSCILRWNQNHFVVLYKQKRGKKFYIADLDKGLKAGKFVLCYFKQDTCQTHFLDADETDLTDFFSVYICD